MDEKRKEEIQKYIDSISNTDVYDHDSFAIKLENFDGPIDLLWFLIRRSKIDVSEVFISDITEQYLLAIKDVEKLDMEKASDFLFVASCLMEIKSNRMLPAPPVVPVPDDENPEKILMARLLEYREKYYPLYKDASKKMKDQENTDSFYRAPDSSVGKPRLVLADMTMDGLVGALQKLFLKIDQRAKENKVKTIVMDRFTVEERVNQLKEIFTLDAGKKITFYDLIEEDYSKREIITTFQSILELLKVQYVKVVQEEIFGEIVIFKNPEADEQKDLMLDDYGDNRVIEQQDSEE